MERKLLEKMKVGDRVQVWDEEKYVCLGWATLVSFKGKKPIFIFNGMKYKKSLTDNRLRLIPEKKAIEIAKRIFSDLNEKEEI